MAAARKNWTLEGARALLPDVRDRTATAVSAVEKLLEVREREGEGTPATEQIDAKVAKLTADWARAMEALGLDVKGLWLVDFDNGGGYYCWRYPEPALQYYHSYEDGFGGRIRIH